MEATQSFGTFQRLYKELVTFLTRPVFAKPAPIKRRAVRPTQPVASPAVAKAVPPAVVEPPKVERVIPQPAVPVAEQPVVAPAVKTQAPEEKPMRTLAEVRADLARLREKSRERQAQQRAAVREDSFPATDFMAFGPSASESRAAKQDEAGEGFASTAYLDFTVLKSR